MQKQYMEQTAVKSPKNSPSKPKSNNYNTIDTRTVRESLTVKALSIKATERVKNAANSAMRKAEWGNGIILYTQVINTDIDINKLSCYNNRALAYIKIKDFVNADKDTCYVLSKFPRNINALQRRATARKELGGKLNIASAIKDLTLLLEIDSGNILARAEKALLEESLQLSSFRDIPFKSDSMKSFLMHSGPIITTDIIPLKDYSSKDLLPSWVTNNPNWRNSRGQSKEHSVSDVLQVPTVLRNQDQKVKLADWIMSVWPLANTIGSKNVLDLVQSFQYLNFEPRTTIVIEGEVGTHFYLVVMGAAECHKQGVTVGQLVAGQTFGEVLSHK